MSVVARTGRLKFLVDTNIIIPIEPTSAGNLESGSEHIARLLGLAAQGKHDIFIHPLIQLDLARDKDRKRRRAREILLKKYQALPDPPAISSFLRDSLGDVDESSHDFVDHSLLAALHADAVDFLVTEDRAIRSKAIRLGLEKRVTTVRDALTICIGLAQAPSLLPPAVRETVAHSLDEKDPIFDSLRADYDDFDVWLRRCKRAHRKTWVIDGPKGRIAALCIVKEEDEAPLGSGGTNIRARILKICTLKVAKESFGHRFGELLLKTVFNFILGKGFEFLYVSCFEKHPDMIQFLGEFGFVDTGTADPSGERYLSKRLQWNAADRSASDPLSFHIRFGPHALDAERPESYIIPIQPPYHDMLFPDAAEQKLLMVGRDPFGNSIRKAYLCGSPMRRIAPGSVLFFYRSGDSQAISVVGVAEETLVSKVPSEIARFVGRQTVYSFDEIVDMCNKPVLAILFRQSRILKNPLRIGDILKGGILRAPPQSIVTVPSERKPWLAQWIEQQS